MNAATHGFLHEVLGKAGAECRLCVLRNEVISILGARIRDMQVENLFIALFACPCCYDGAQRVSTGLVLGQKCVVCDGTGRRPKFDPEEPDAPSPRDGGR